MNNLTEEQVAALAELFEYESEGELIHATCSMVKIHYKDFGKSRTWNDLIGTLQEVKCWVPDYDNDVFYINHEKEHMAIWECICREALPTLNKEIIYNHIVGFVKWKVAIDATAHNKQ